MGMISSYKNEQGVECISVDSVHFIAVNIYEDKDGALVISPPNHKIPDDAKQVIATANKSDD